uniref:Uncharacterized protein n=1 Tax=Rhizophagus irregularis (strain DAOM 181602 / DAOM 197198 / MUCL 43194) TaxID=747089 RepID=U9UJ79_RHIID
MSHPTILYYYSYHSGKIAGLIAEVSSKNIKPWASHSDNEGWNATAVSNLFHPK